MSMWSVTHSDAITTVGNRAYFRGSLCAGVSFPVDSYGYIVICGEQYRPASDAEAQNPNAAAVEPFRSIQETGQSPWTYQDDGIFVAIEEVAPSTFMGLVENACSVAERYRLTDFWCIPHHRDVAMAASEQAYHVAKKRVADRGQESWRSRFIVPVFVPIKLERSEVQLQREAVIRALIERRHLLVDGSCNMIRSQNEKAVEALGCAIFALHRYRPRVVCQDDAESAPVAMSYYGSRGGDI